MCFFMFFFAPLSLCLVGGICLPELNAQTQRKTKERVQQKCGANMTPKTQFSDPNGNKEMCSGAAKIDVSKNLSNKNLQRLGSAIAPCHHFTKRFFFAEAKKFFLTFKNLQIS